MTPLTILVNDLLSGRFPLLFREDLHHDDITIHRSVHVLPTDQQDRLVKTHDIDSALDDQLRTNSQGRRLTSK
jgi:hypothetical protein